jgi:5-(carboxyamino)imidazole ribonucleotide synthase
LTGDPFSTGEPLSPGSMIGIIGGGQLGRMTAMAARQFGYRIAVLDPDADSPAAQVADRVIVAAYSDRDAARDLARICDVLTYEFENVDADAVEAAMELSPLIPSGSVLRTAQNRVLEKGALQRHGLPTADYRAIESEEQYLAALKAIGGPWVLKTATSGYDGKGQVVIREPDNGGAYRELKDRSPALILERFVPFRLELSVICARDRSSELVTFPPSENVHVDGILDISIVPARIEPHIAERAAELAMSVAEALDVNGLIAVEMFLTHDAELLINELAPRPHNSGHYTIEACRTSQYEQLVRVMCGLPMGSVEMPRPAVMVNLLGDVWADTDGNPDWAAAVGVPGTSLHLYGKSEARPGRKMGHITVIADSVEIGLERAELARSLARRRAASTLP